MQTSFFKCAGAIAVMTIAAACSPTVTMHGHRMDQDALAQIQPGVTSREEVVHLLGSPSATGTFDGERWYYISQRSEQMSFYQSQITAQDVIAIDFDKAGVVADLGKRDVTAALDVTPSTAKTRTMGNEFTLMEQFLGNVGRFNTDPNAPSAFSRTVGRQ